MTWREPPGGPKTRRIPTPDDLVDAPELAILAALELMLDLAVRALVCEHPELADPERPYWLPQASPLDNAAHTVVGSAADLKQALITYREAIDIRRQDDAPDRDPP
jgi:hypothetical protein